jgi:hypothetical protein
MNEKVNEIASSLIKLYANENVKAEAKFRLKLRSIDWDKEENCLKSRLNVFRILFSILFVLFVLLLVVFIMHIRINTVSISTTTVAISICASSIICLFLIKHISRKQIALKLLRQLMEK